MTRILSPALMARSNHGQVHWGERQFTSSTFRYVPSIKYCSSLMGNLMNLFSRKSTGISSNSAHDAWSAGHLRSDRERDSEACTPGSNRLVVRHLLCVPVWNSAILL